MDQPGGGVGGLRLPGWWKVGWVVWGRGNGKAGGAGGGERGAGRSVPQWVRR